MPLDDATAEAYVGGAPVYEANRPPRHRDRAEDLVADLVAAGATGPILDAGCGTGAYLPTLDVAPGGAVGLDVVPEMLARTGHRPLVRADLARLPVRPGSLAAVWARNSWVHTPTDELPVLLAEAHRALPVGGRLVASVLSAEHDDQPSGGNGTSGGSFGDDAFVSDDDLPGRRFWRQTDATLVDLAVGAGFTDVALDGVRPRFLGATRARTLPDTVGPGLRLLVCGLNPSLHAADAGLGFVTPSNRFWPAAVAAGLVAVPRDPWRALHDHGVGMTDLVKRATRRADELEPAEYRAGFARLERLCERLRPGAVVFVGLAGWRAAVDRRARVGVQDRTVGGVPAYVMGSTSGLNAHATLDDHVAHLRAALALADRS